MRYLPALDGLRAIAVLAVVAYHAGLPIPAGFVGVDVFFVISGYVITRMLAREHQETGRIDFGAFYARRVRRILPALVAVVAVVLAVSMVLLAPTYLAAVVRSAIASMAVTANFHFAAVSGGYFDAGADQMPLLHLWSLAVEEQSYFVWPLLLAPLLRYRSGPFILAALAIASFLVAQSWAGGAATEAAFYQMPARFWELAAGGLIALTPARSRPVAAYVGLLLIAIAVMAPMHPFPGTGAVPAVLGAALVIHAVHGGVSVPLLQLAPMRWIGLLSYSFYLWHWPLLALNRATSMDAPPLWENIALCGTALILAALSYRYVEMPLRRKQAPRAKTIAVGVTACLVLAGCAGAVGASIRHDDFGSRTAKDFPAITSTCHAQMDTPPHLPPASCGTGDVVLWGDSHAYAWRPYADRFGAVLQITRSNCSPSAGDPNGWLCAQHNALAVERAKQGKTVILSAQWLHLFGSTRAQATRDGVTSALAALAAVERVVVMGPLPMLPYSAQHCIDRGQISACTVSRADFDRQAATARAFLIAAAALHPNAEYVEPVAFFCTELECPMMKDGYSLYWDDDHISATAARRFTP